MITGSENCEWKIIKKGEIEKKKGEKLDISISNHKTELVNFLRYTAFTILATFKRFVARP